MEPKTIELTELDGKKFKIKTDTIKSVKSDRSGTYIITIHDKTIYVKEDLVSVLAHKIP